MGGGLRFLHCLSTVQKPKIAQHSGRKNEWFVSCRENLLPFPLAWPGRAGLPPHSLYGLLVPSFLHSDLSYTPVRRIFLKPCCDRAVPLLKYLKPFLKASRIPPCQVCWAFGACFSDSALLPCTPVGPSA